MTLLGSCTLIRLRAPLPLKGASAQLGLYNLGLKCFNAITPVKYFDIRFSQDFPLRLLRVPAYRQAGLRLYGLIFAEPSFRFQGFESHKC